MTRVDYIRCQRSSKRILLMIACVWLLATVISLAPAFGWKDANFERRIVESGECLLSQDVYYQVFATCATFYFPVTATLIFYWKIYQVSQVRFVCSFPACMRQFAAKLKQICLFAGIAKR